MPYIWTNDYSDITLSYTWTVIHDFVINWESLFCTAHWLHDFEFHGIHFDTSDKSNNTLNLNKLHVKSVNLLLYDKNLLYSIVYIKQTEFIMKVYRNYHFYDPQSRGFCAKTLMALDEIQFNALFLLNSSSIVLLLSIDQRNWIKSYDDQPGVNQKVNYKTRRAGARVLGRAHISHTGKMHFFFRIFSPSIKHKSRKMNIIFPGTDIYM